MADSIVEEVVAQAVENITENANKPKIPATPEGMMLAYGSLVAMAMLPIYYGAIQSVKHQKKVKVRDLLLLMWQSINFPLSLPHPQDSGETPETMTKNDAMMFPLIASGALLGLYVVFKIFSVEHINLLLTGYFFFLGVLALSHVLSPIVSKLVPASIPKIPFHLVFSQGGEGGPKPKEDLINYKFNTHDMVCVFISLIIGVWYLWKKHWIANNLFGLAYAINGVEMLHLNNVVTGCILLGGLFIYDIFWVFGTNVMVTVAKSFEAPIKLVFPQDILTNGLSASNFAMLGLGDIVIPGIFIALLLRYDNSRRKNSRLYFYITYAAYLFGLLATIFVMHRFKHAQPALLYLVPACLASPLLVALIKGDIKKMFA